MSDDYDYEILLGYPPPGPEKELIHTAWKHKKSNTAWVVTDVKERGRGWRVHLEAADSNASEQVRLKDLTKNYESIPLDSPSPIPPLRVALP